MYIFFVEPNAYLCLPRVLELHPSPGGRMEAPQGEGDTGKPTTRQAGKIGRWDCVKPLDFFYTKSSLLYHFKPFKNTTTECHLDMEGFFSQKPFMESFFPSYKNIQY